MADGLFGRWFTSFLEKKKDMNQHTHRNATLTLVFSALLLLPVASTWARSASAPPATSGKEVSAALVVPRASNIDYFLSHTCYGAVAHEEQNPGDTPESLAQTYVDAGCKFIRWGDFAWRMNSKEGPHGTFDGFTPEYFEHFRRFVAAVHALDPQVVVEAALSEFICEYTVDHTAYDFTQFPGLEQHGAGTFSFENVRRTEPWYENHWGYLDGCGGRSGVPAAFRPQGLLFYRWLTANYVRAGAEAVNLTGTFWTIDNSEQLVPEAAMVREIGALLGRRGSVLVGGEFLTLDRYQAMVVDPTDPAKALVDYMKGMADLDVVRTAGTATTPATATTTAATGTLPCVDDFRMLWESALGERLKPGELCIVDAPYLRDGSYFKMDGTLNPEYGKYSIATSFQLAANNPLRIPVILETDGAGLTTPIGRAGTIRDGVNSLTVFFASRRYNIRQRFLRHFAWVGRHFTAREGVPTYAEVPVKMDQYVGYWPGGVYEGLFTYCPGGANTAPRLHYSARADICNDIASVGAGHRVTPAASGLVAFTDHGRFSPQGGGFAMNLCAPGATPYRRAEILPDQSGYYLLDTAGAITACGAAAPWTSQSFAGERIDLAIDPATAAGLVLVRDGAQCRVLRASGAQVGAAFACASPVAMATGSLFQPAFVVLQASGALWIWNGSAWSQDSRLATAPDVPLPAGDSWNAMTLVGGDVYVASRMGQVARLRGTGRVQTVQTALWPYLIGEDLAAVTGPAGTDRPLLYLLDSASGIHQVVRALDGQTAADFPAMFPYAYYGMPGERAVGLSPVYAP